MKITHIECSASRTFNHPTERYANFRFNVKMTAELDEGLERHMIHTATDNLRQRVENVAELHKREILAEISNAARRETLERNIVRGEAAPAAIEKAKAIMAQMDCLGSTWQLDDAKDNIRILEACLAELPENRRKLAAIPTPILLPSPEIHAGHPDHPDTDEGNC